MHTHSDLVHTLMQRSKGDRLTVRLENGDEYTVDVTAEVEYEKPDQYGAGFVGFEIHFDATVHDIPSRELPMVAGRVSAGSGYLTTSFDTPTLAVWSPPNDELNDDEIRNLGYVQEIVVEEAGPEAV